MLNDIKIHGYLGRDPELKEYKNAKGEDGKLVNLSVGVSRNTEGTDWFDATFFGRKAEVIDKFFAKGSQIIISGRMQSNVVEKDGRKSKYWNIIGEKFDFCDSKDSPRGSSSEAAQGEPQTETTDNWEEQEGDIPF